MCSVNCVINAYIYLYHHELLSLETCGVFLQSKPFNSRKLFRSRLSGKSLLHKGLAVLGVRPVGSSAVAAVLPPVEVGVA